MEAGKRRRASTAGNGMVQITLIGADAIVSPNIISTDRS